MSFKNLMFASAYVLLTFMIMRFVVPSLLSQQDTIQVVMGFTAAICWFTCTAFIAIKAFKKEEK